MHRLLLLMLLVFLLRLLRLLLLLLCRGGAQGAGLMCLGRQAIQFAGTLGKAAAAAVMGVLAAAMGLLAFRALHGRKGRGSSFTICGEQNS